MKGIRLLVYVCVLGLGVALSAFHWRGLEGRRALHQRNREEAKSKSAELEAVRTEEQRAEAYLHLLQSDPFAFEKELREKGNYLKPGETAYQIRVAPEGAPVQPQPDARVSSPPGVALDAPTPAPERGGEDGPSITPPVEAPMAPGP